MTLPAFASLDELEARMGDVDDDRAQAALDDASALIRAEAGKTWVTDDELDEDVPDILRVITIAVARRVLENPEAVTQESVGAYSVAYSASSSDVYLTSNERRQVRRAAGKLGVFTQATTRSDSTTAGLETPGPVVDGYARVAADSYLEVEGRIPIPFE